MQTPEPDRYAVVGHPIRHSRSPLIHGMFARQAGDRLSYDLIDAEPDAFEEVVREFFAAGGKGLNVTVPHKRAAYQLAERIGQEAALAQAVNTLSLEHDAIRGDNTDGIGFMRDLTVNLRQSVSGKRVLILGAGGAARGIVAPLLGGGPAELWLANRTLERAHDLRQAFLGLGEIVVSSFEDLDQLPPFDIVINATSAGLTGVQPTFPGNLVDSGSFCYDLVYGAEDTPFVAWARAHGAGQAEQGWGMLVEQAAESYLIWRGHRPDTSAVLATLAT